MEESDLALFMVDHRFAATLGIMPPKCARCGGDITRPPHDWDGLIELRHLFLVACEWERERQREIAIGELRNRQGSMAGSHGEPNDAKWPQIRPAYY